MNRMKWVCWMVVLTPSLFLCSGLVAQECTSIISGPDTIDVCPGSTMTFDGIGSIPSAGSAITNHHWLINGESVAYTPVIDALFDSPGGQRLQLVVTDLTGCIDTSSVLLLVSPRAELFFEVEGNPCLGDTLEISASSIQRPVFHYTRAPAHLPDLDTAAFTVVIDQFPSDALVFTGADIASICVDIEHSYMDDLVIQLTCPNGDTLLLHQGGGGATYLGSPVDSDHADPTPGGCGYYCWTPDPALNDWVESSEYGETPNVTYLGDNASLRPGTYRSLNSFDDLVGCPLNGTWTLTISDRLAGDNGSLCGFTIQFEGQPLPGPDSGNVTILDPQIGWNCDSLTWQGLDILAIDDACSAIRVAPNSPGIQVLSLTATDDHGCMFTGSTSVEILHFDPHISGPTLPPFGIPVDYSVQTSAGSPIYLWTSNTAEVYFYTLPNAQAAWTTAENSWIAVRESRGPCFGTDTLFIDGLIDVPEEDQERPFAYPNPANEALTVPLGSAPSGPLTLRIADPIGRLIGTGSVVDRSRPFQLDTRTVPTGYYILEMKGPDEVRSLPFMVVH